MDPDIRSAEENKKDKPPSAIGPGSEIEFHTSLFWPRHLIDLIFRPRKFFSSQIAINKTPYLLFVTWCYGISSTIQRIDSQMIRADFGPVRSGWQEALPYIANSWLYFWGFVLVFGLISAAFIWLIGGWWYRLRIRWSGDPAPDKRLARLTYVYASFIATGTSVILAVIYTISYPNYQQAWLAEDSISLIWIIFPFWSCIVSYKGVATLFEIKKLRAILWFLILPAMVYASVLGMMAMMYIFNGKYANQSEPQWDDFESGLHLVLKMANQANSSMGIADTEAAREILSERLHQFGISNIMIRVENDGMIIIQTPYYNDPQRLIDLLTTPAHLEFRLVHPRAGDLLKTPDRIPPGSEILYKAEPVSNAGETIKTPFLVKRRPRLTGAHIKNAKMAIDTQFDEPYISIEFDEKGSKLLEKITGENVGRQLAIIIDRRVYSAPVIQEKIQGGSARITGHFDAKEAEDLALLFNSGPLPAKIEVLEHKTLKKEMWLGSTNEAQD